MNSFVQEGCGYKQRNKSGRFSQNKQWLSLNSGTVGDLYFPGHPFLYFLILFFNNEHRFL